MAMFKFWPRSKKPSKPPQAAMTSSLAEPIGPSSFDLPAPPRPAPLPAERAPLPLPPAAPTLIIGLGGVGRWILTYLKKALLDTYRGEWPDKVRLLALDTAFDEADALVGGVALDDGQELLWLGQNLFAFSQRLKARPEVYPDLQLWWPAGNRALSPEILNTRQGVNGERAIGRLTLFNDSYGVGRTQAKLGALLGELLARQPGLTPRIFLISALGGGSGSGLLFDLAHLTRQYAIKISGSLSLNAFLIAHNRTASSQFERRANEQALVNTYAALRELERFLLTVNTPYPINYRQEESISRQRLFENCFIFDNAPPGTSLSARQPIEHVYSMIANTVLALLNPQAHKTFMRHFRDVERDIGRLQNQQDMAMVSRLHLFSYILPVANLMQVSAYRFLLELLQKHWLKVKITSQGKPELDSKANEEDPAAPQAALAFMQSGLRGARIKVPALLPPLRRFIQEGRWPSPGDLALALPANFTESDSNRRRHHFASYLSEALLLILNGRAENPFLARGGKLGYAIYFTDLLAEYLRRLERRAMVLNMNNPNRQTEIVYTLLKEYAQCLKQVREELARWTSLLLDGQERALRAAPDAIAPGSPGAEQRESQGVLTLLQQGYEAALRRARHAPETPNHIQLFDQAAEPVYQTCLQPHLSRAMRYIWWQVDRDALAAGRFQLEVAIETPAANTSQAEQSAPDNTEAGRITADLLALARHLGREIWRQPIIPYLAQNFEPHELARSLQRQSLPLPATLTPNSAPPVITCYLSAPAEGDDYIRRLKTALTKQRAQELEVQLIPALNPQTLTLLTAIDYLPLPHLDLYRRAQSSYLYHPDRAGLHIFAAEQRAVEYEQMLPQIDEASRLFHPRFTILLERHQWVKIFALSYAYGDIYWIEEAPAVRRYILQVPEQGIDLYLNAPEDRRPPLLAAVEQFTMAQKGYHFHNQNLLDIPFQAVQARLKQKRRENPVEAMNMLNKFINLEIETWQKRANAQAEKDLLSFFRLIARSEQTALYRAGLPENN